MDLHEAVSRLIIDTRGQPGAGLLPVSATSSLGVFLPEIVLCLTIVLVLLGRVLRSGPRFDAFYLAFAGAVLALYLGTVKAPLLDQRMEFFTGLLVYDNFTVFMRGFLLLFTVLFLLLTRLTGIPDRVDSADIYTLVLGAVVGMCLMVSANHLLMVFLAVEMASVPSYVLAGLMKGRPRASEAALKYAIYGAGASGVMLYGISLIAGLANTAHLPSIARELAVRLPGMPGDEWMVLALGGLMVMVGLAFKLSAVPFHFWCPDVFEGATAEIDALLSVASKGAALALLVRVVLGLAVPVPEGLKAGEARAWDVAESQEPATLPGWLAVADDVQTVSARGTTNRDAAGGQPGIASLQGLLARLVALLAAVTCTFGNLAAYGQTNIKRLLAYSTIAHAGYMMMAVPPMLAMAAGSPAGSERAAAALALYLAIYLFLNLGAFAIVALLRNRIRSEEIADYAGLIRHCPGVVLCFAAILFGLVGIPPLSGFLGKFAIFASLAEGYRSSSEVYLIVLLVIGGINTAISLFYYLRVVKTMALDADAETRGPVQLPLVSWPGIYLVVVTLPTLLLILGWDFLNRIAQQAAQQLLG